MPPDRSDLPSSAVKVRQGADLALSWTSADTSGKQRRRQERPESAKPSKICYYTNNFFVYPKNNKVNLAGCVSGLIKTGSSLSKSCFL